MTIDITYEQALAAAPTLGLRDKIQHSVELIRRSERLALKYKDDGFVVGFSGGKDSQCVLHLCQLAGVKHVGWFSPTSVDPPEVIRFIRQQYPEVKWTKLEMSIYEHTVRMGCLPTMRIRHCCAAFKENKHPGTVTIVGVRRAESTRRARRNEVEVSGRKFSGDLDGFELWSEKKVERIKKKYKNLNQDQFAEYSSESSIRCVGGKDSIIILPILEWTDQDVWAFLNQVVKAPHCSLYDEGRNRIGCIMCPFSSAKNMLADIKRWPHVYWKWVEAVRAIREGRTTLKNTPPHPQDTDNEIVTTPPIADNGAGEKIKGYGLGQRSYCRRQMEAMSEPVPGQSPQGIRTDTSMTKDATTKPPTAAADFRYWEAELQGKGGYSRAIRGKRPETAGAPAWAPFSPALPARAI